LRLSILSNSRRNLRVRRTRMRNWLLFIPRAKHVKHSKLRNTNNDKNNSNPNKKGQVSPQRNKSHHSANTKPSPPRNRSHYFITSKPVYFCKTLGMLTLPSLFWKFSIMATSALVVATQVLFSV